MFTSILRKFGLVAQKAAVAQQQISSIRGDVVAEGDQAHHHDFKRGEWDDARLGPGTTNFEKDHGGALEFPMCTYKELFACSCGRQVVRSTHSLI